MTAKQYLNQIRTCENAITEYKREIARLEEDMIRISGIDYSRPRVDSSPQADFVSAAIMDEITQAKSRMHALIDEERAAREKIVVQIRRMQTEHEIYRSILWKRYVDLLSFRDIAEQENYSLDYIIHAHGWALQEFERNYKDDIK